MELLKRKIDEFLSEWKQNPDRLPLIVKGARQVGKTASIRQFGESNYTNVVEINFLLQKQYCDIFDDGFETDTIIRNIVGNSIEIYGGKSPLPIFKYNVPGMAAASRNAISGCE